jgi:hypothetical protein
MISCLLELEVVVRHLQLVEGFNLRHAAAVTQGPSLHQVIAQQHGMGGTQPQVLVWTLFTESACRNPDRHPTGCAQRADPACGVPKKLQTANACIRDNSIANP